MKKSAYFILASLFAINLQAQVIDNEGLQRLINELKALNGKHVIYKSENDIHPGFRFPTEIVNFKLNDEDVSLSDIITSDSTLYYITTVSKDKTGYNLIQSVFYKYYNEESEDIFGIPLQAYRREDGEEEILFMGGKNTLLIIDDGIDEIMIIYSNYNLTDIINRALNKMLEITDEEYVDVNIVGGMDFSVEVGNTAEPNRSSGDVYTPRADSNEIMALARKIYEDRILNIENLLARADSTEKQEGLATTLDRLKEEKDESLADLEQKLDELDKPSFIEIVPGSDEYYVATPRIPAHLKEKVKPYAANGIYDWINKKNSFRAGYKVGYTDIISCIITPHDVARECIIRHYPRNKWYDDGFTAEYKNFAAIEYQGSTPAILYSFSQNEKGYNEMLNDFADFFSRKLGDKIEGLEVIQCSENNGKRFVGLWGEGGIQMYLYDFPADKYCHISIIIGGISGFEQALNEYNFGGEKNFAKRYNIVINSDLRDNSYGIHFATEEYFFAGKSHKNGVHIDFGNARRYAGLEPVEVK